MRPGQRYTARARAGYLVFVVTVESGLCDGSCVHSSERDMSTPHILDEELLTYDGHHAAPQPGAPSTRTAQEGRSVRL